MIIARIVLASLIFVTLVGNLITHGRKLPSRTYDAKWAVVAIGAEVGLIWLAGGWG